MTERNPYHPHGLWPTAGSYTRTDEDWKARAEKAEKERDEWKDSAIKAMADLERAEQPRPLIPDDAMVLRALNADMWEEHKVGPWGSLDSFRTPAVDAMRAVLTAALTEPTRPEGAEGWEDWLIHNLDHESLTDQQIEDLANRVAQRVTEEQL